MSDHGSIKRLNWVTPNVVIPQERKPSYIEKSIEAARCGTPPTRGNNVITPPVIVEHGPSLYLNKAIRVPVKYTASGPQFQRKRDPHSGKFAASEDVGSQSTAEEDKAKTEREHKLRAHEKLESLLELREGGRHVRRLPSPGERSGKGGAKRSVKKAAPSVPAQLPGAPKAIAPQLQNDTKADVMGHTTHGLDIFDDPYFSGHEDFSPEDHEEAEMLNRLLSDEAETPEDTMRFMNNADAHEDRRKDSLSPSDRFVESMNSMDDRNNGSFDNLLSQPDVSPEQNKPLMAASGSGPAPGMKHTATGGPVGPMTNVNERPQDAESFGGDDYDDAAYDDDFSMESMLPEDEGSLGGEEDFAYDDSLETAPTGDSGSPMDSGLDLGAIRAQLQDLMDLIDSGSAGQELNANGTKELRTPPTHAGAFDSIADISEGEMPRNRMSGVPGHLGGNPNHNTDGTFSPPDGAASTTIAVGEGAEDNPEAPGVYGQGPGSDSYQRQLYEAQQKAIEAMKQY